jgi:hypothetical protein
MGYELRVGGAGMIDVQLSDAALRTIKEEPQGMPWHDAEAVSRDLGISLIEMLSRLDPRDTGSQTLDTPANELSSTFGAMI